MKKVVIWIALSLWSVMTVFAGETAYHFFHGSLLRLKSLPCKDKASPPLLKDKEHGQYFKSM